MPLFRKKPVTIEARRFTGDFGIADWVIDGGGHVVVEYDNDRPSDLFIRTLEGPMRVGDGDWVIKGVKGEFYPCKPDIFEMTYDPVVESAHGALDPTDGSQ